MMWSMMMVVLAPFNPAGARRCPSTVSILQIEYTLFILDPL